MQLLYIITHERLNQLHNGKREEFKMPDISKYSSVSLSKAAYKELVFVKEHLSEELGVTFSLAKLIEHLAKDKVKSLGLN